MSEINADQINAALKSLYSRAASDANFRALCLSDPAAAAKSVGLALPSAVNIKFVERKVGESLCDSVYVLPPFAADLDDLQDDQLSEISGGGTFGGTYEDMAVAAQMFDDHNKLMKEMNQGIETLTAMLKRANGANSGIIRNLP